MGRVKSVLKFWKDRIYFWKDFKFWKLPKPNLSRIFPKIFPEIWKDWNLSKIFESFQTLYFSGLRGIGIFPKIFPHAQAQARARNYMEKYIPIGDIYFSNVISLERLESFQNSAAKFYDASPLSPPGRLAVKLPQKGELA